MAASKADREFVDHLVELMAPVGPVRARAMFGGHGLFLDGLMFALVADRSLYLKADAGLAAEFAARGLDAFTYDKGGKPVRMSYYPAPEEALEDPEAMADWARRSYAAAARSSTGKRR